MIRSVTAGMVFAALGIAPVQCRHDPDPNLRREDSAGDALYALAQDFHAKGNDEASRQTLRFLVERYPSNRNAPAARADLEGAGAEGAAGPAAPAAHDAGR